MTDKEKLNAIKAEVQNYIDAAHKAHTNITEGNFAHLLSFINSLQEEPVRRTPADIESVMQEIEEKSKAFTEAHQGEDADTILAQMRGEEPVSEELEEEIGNYIKMNGYDGLDSIEEVKCIANHFAKWGKNHLWKPADGDDLPEIDREVVAFQETFPTDIDVPSLLKIVMAHRPNPKGYDGKSIATGKVEHYTPKTYDKGGWNIPNVVLWLDLNIPKLEED